MGLTATVVFTLKPGTHYPVSTRMGDRLPWYVTKPTRSTQPCISLGPLDRVPVGIGRGKGGNVTSAGCQVTLCDPIMAHEFP